MSILNTLQKDLALALGLEQSALHYYFMLPFTIGNWIWILPAAIFVDLFSVRKVMLSMLSLSVIGALGSAWSLNPYLTIFFRFCSGSAHAFCFLSCTTIVSRWFTPSKRATVMGIVVAVGLSGILAAQFPLYYLKLYFGWQKALTCNALIGVFFFMLSYFFLEDHPHEGVNSSISWQEKKEEVMKMLPQAFLNLQVWLFALYAALLNAPFPGFIFYDLNAFLQSYHQVLPEERAVLLSTLLLVAHILGSSFSGWISERWQSRKRPMMWASFLSMLCLTLLLVVGPWSIWTLAAILMVFGFLMGAQVLAYPAIVEISDPRIVATAMSVASLIVVGSFSIIPLIRGSVEKVFVKGSDSPTNYPIAYGAILFLLGISLLIAWCVEETYGAVDAEEKEKGSKKIS